MKHYKGSTGTPMNIEKKPKLIKIKSNCVTCFHSYKLQKSDILMCSYFCDVVDFPKTCAYYSPKFKGEKNKKTTNIKKYYAVIKGKSNFVITSTAEDCCNFINGIENSYILACSSPTEAKKIFAQYKINDGLKVDKTFSSINNQDDDLKNLIKCYRLCDSIQKNVLLETAKSFVYKDDNKNIDDEII